MYLSVVGVATGWPEIESLCERSFRNPSRSALGPTHSPIEWVPCVFPVGKRPGRDFGYPPHLASRLKKEYNYSFPPPPPLPGHYDRL